MARSIKLDFGSFKLVARLFDTPLAGEFLKALPRTAELTRWGRELYGPFGAELFDEKPVSSIPPGGIAYSKRGSYVCLFFGQTPAWPVNHIGTIEGDSWKRLEECGDSATVTISAS